MRNGCFMYTTMYKFDLFVKICTVDALDKK